MDGRNCISKQKVELGCLCTNMHRVCSEVFKMVPWNERFRIGSETAR